jgi:multiple sugar transport system permease protein
MVILFPIFFLVSFSFMSGYESYYEWPNPLIPSFVSRYKIEWLEQGYGLSIYNKAEKQYERFGPESFTESPEDLEKVSVFVARQGNTELPIERLQRELAKLDQETEVYFTLRKNLLTNYRVFFQVTRDAVPSVIRSVYTALATVAISLSIGGLAGFAFARYIFAGKNMLKFGVLFVRMFPGVAIAIPMIIILGRIGLYDQPLGLSLIYSVTQISLTIWITASVFMSIPVELEEAALIFGTSRFGAFWHVTLPLALPGLAACAMYAFLGSWNEVIQAVVFTQFRPTFPVVVYKVLVGAGAQVNLVTAGSIAQALPAVLFTLIIRKYIQRMWGGVSV